MQLILEDPAMFMYSQSASYMVFVAFSVNQRFLSSIHPRKSRRYKELGDRGVLLQHR